jgi:pimeloyl-ACP methyl ester carboxylesterase
MTARTEDDGRKKGAFEAEVGLFDEASWQVATRSTESPTTPGTPGWEARALRRLAGRGVTALPLRYARRAGGEATGWLFSPRGAPRGAPRARLIYAHGTGNDALYPQVELVRRLTEAQVEVVLFDLDGHGRGASTVLEAAGASDAFADAAAAAPPSEIGVPLYLGGQSLGGALALKASMTIASVRGVVGISAPSRLGLTEEGRPTPPFLPLAYEATSVLRPAVWGQLAHYGPWGIWPALGALKRDAYPIRLPPGSGAAKAAFGYVGAVAEVVASLGLGDAAAETEADQAPPRALLIYGGRDKIVPPSEGERIAARWRDARVVTIPGATHFSLPFERRALEETVAFVVSERGRTT